jgi:hypothetical protein
MEALNVSTMIITSITARPIDSLIYTSDNVCLNFYILFIMSE